MGKNTRQTTPGKAHPGRRPAGEHWAMAAMIREALLHLGGEAHRSTVIQHVARQMGHDERRIPADLQTLLIVSFEQALRDEARRQALGFRLPFGEGSHRWSLDHAARA